MELIEKAKDGKRQKWWEKMENEKSVEQAKKFGRRYKKLKNTKRGIKSKKEETQVFSRPSDFSPLLTLQNILDYLMNSQQKKLKFQSKISNRPF